MKVETFFGATLLLCGLSPVFAQKTCSSTCGILNKTTKSISCSENQIAVCGCISCGPLCLENFNKCEDTLPKSKDSFLKMSLVSDTVKVEKKEVKPEFDSSTLSHNKMNGVDEDGVSKIEKQFSLFMRLKQISGTDAGYWSASADVRSLPALGFFPFGGNMDVNEEQLSTYIIGAAADFFNWQGADWRLSPINVSAYLFGFNYSSINTQEKGRFLNLGYFRVGPHYRFSGLFKDKLSFGVQCGYGLLLKSIVKDTGTQYMHGIDLSFTFSWTDYVPMHLRKEFGKVISSKE